MLSIPIINRLSTAETRPQYLRLLRRVHAGRVFLVPENPFRSREEMDKPLSLLRENLEFYAAPAPGETGLETAVWIGGLGHGGALAHTQAAVTGHYTKLRGLSNGGEADDSFCPLDPEYRAKYIGYVTEIARIGAPMIMIDDDLRMARHGAGALCCACDRHMELFNERAKAAGLADHDYTREDLAAVLFTSSPDLRFLCAAYGSI